MTQNKKILLALLLVISFGVVLVAKVWFFSGTLEIKANTAPFQVSIKGFDKNIFCANKICQIQVPSKNLLIKIVKDNYFSQEREIEILRNKIISWEIKLKMIPSVKPLAKIPIELKKNNQEIFNQKTPFFIDQKKSLFYFLNIKTGKFFLKKGSKKVLLAEFIVNQKLKKSKIQVSEDSVFVQMVDEIYEINIAEKRKFRIYKSNNELKFFVHQGTIFVEDNAKILIRSKEN